MGSPSMASGRAGWGACLAAVLLCLPVQGSGTGEGASGGVDDEGFAKSGPNPMDKVRSSIERNGAGLSQPEKQRIMERASQEWRQLQWGSDARPVDEGAQSRGLVTRSLDYESVLSEHHKYARATGKRFAAPTLAFVTPWNDYGYQAADLFRDKFDVLIPAWFELSLRVKPAAGGGQRRRVSVSLRGSHLVNSDWLARMADAGKAVIPRVFVDADKSGWDRFVSSQKTQAAIAKKLTSTCEYYGLSGVLLDAADAWPHAGTGAARKRLNAFIVRLGKGLLQQNPGGDGAPPRLFLAVPPALKGTDRRYFGERDMEQTRNGVSIFVVMTMDYSTGGRPQPGPAAPTEWVARSARAVLGKVGLADPALCAQVAIVIDFQGKHYRNGQAAELSGQRYVELLEKHKPDIRWDPKAREHVAVFKDSDDGAGLDILNYPSLASIADRVGVAETMGVALAVWDVGQGLHYFFDLI